MQSCYFCLFGFFFYSKHSPQLLLPGGTPLLCVTLAIAFAGLHPWADSRGAFFTAVDGSLPWSTVSKLVSFQEMRVSQAGLAVLFWTFVFLSYNENSTAHGRHSIVGFMQIYASLRIRKVLLTGKQSSWQKELWSVESLVNLKQQ